MMHDQHGILQRLQIAQNHLPAAGMVMTAGLRAAMPRRRAFSSVLSWFSELFMRDGRSMELGVGCAIFAWGVLSDIATDHAVVPPSMAALTWMLSPDTLVLCAYTLGILQVAALATLRRSLRAPIAFAGSIFVGMLTAGACRADAEPLAGAAFYGMAWAMEVYVSIRLCRPKP